MIDYDPIQAAVYLCDEHVVKMMLESCQMLSTALVLKYGYESDDVVMRPAYYNHPCNIWLRERDGNFKWLVKHLNAMIYQYKIRYDNEFSRGVLRYKDILLRCLDLISTMPDNKFTAVPLCMPDIYKIGDCVKSYRAYYTSKQYTFKSGFMSYARGIDTPEWLTDRTQIRTVVKENTNKCKYKPVLWSRIETQT